MRKSVIIVAGGSGTRMGLAIPKQFASIHGKPILVYTIEAFLNYDPNITVVLVLPEVHIPTWQEIKREFLPNQNVLIAQGGSSRFQSVKSGLASISEGLVAIHDAVRPMVSNQVIADCFEMAEQTGSGVAMVSLKDSIRKKVTDLTQSVNRSDYFIVQTPQTFRVELIKKAFEVEENESFTDDASVYEYSGGSVHQVTGDYKNIKITTPEDLILAEAFLNKKASK